MLLQYGKVYLSEQVVDYSSPSNLSSNGTVGGNSFAVSPSSTYNTTYDAFHMFDGSPSTYFRSGTENPITIIVYTPQPTRITSVTITNQDSYIVSATADSYLYVSNNNSTYTSLATFRGTAGAGTQWTINLSSNSTYYKYYKFVTKGTYGYQTIRNMSLTGYYKTDVANSITFPTSYSNTNYAFSLGYIGAVNTSYSTSKTTTGMGLYNPEAGSGSMNWMTIGY